MMVKDVAEVRTKDSTEESTVGSFGQSQSDANSDQVTKEGKVEFEETAKNLIEPKLKTAGEQTPGATTAGFSEEGAKSGQTSEGAFVQPHSEETVATDPGDVAKSDLLTDRSMPESLGKAHTPAKGTPVSEEDDRSSDNDEVIESARDAAQPAVDKLRVSVDNIAAKYTSERMRRKVLAQSQTIENAIRDQLKEEVEEANDRVAFEVHGCIIRVFSLATAVPRSPTVMPLGPICLCTIVVAGSNAPSVYESKGEVPYAVV
ncbi:unnamed protein product [Soboliphyme baturini]|uniref:RAB6-interacting golgin n=1 Tax=Soboliphyme baturini TaxID=241478 RepID=A0A183IVV5_9BILA|nr:unnamed protein product [Soboliphyme baturini]